MKKNFKLILIILFILIIFILIYPNLEFSINNRLYHFTYKEDWTEWEENLCYNESYSYNEKRNISINKWELKKFLFFKLFILDYKPGNVCATEYLIKDEEIKRIIDDGTIIYNDNSIDLSKLIKNKKPIEGNKRYSGNNYENSITYKIDGKEIQLYIFYVDNLLIIQVGLTDEGPKYIAYKQ